MQNNNVSGTITAISGITSRADNNTNDNNNNTAGRQESEQQQSTVQAHGGGMQRYEVSTVQHDGIDAGDEALTARAGHFPLDGQSKDEPTYDRLEVNPLGLHLRSDASDVTRGRGVFSDRRIPAGTLIEEAPVLIITKGQWEEGKMDDCILGEYGFCWSGGGQGIGLGLASLFNHSSSPNVNFIRQPATSTIRFITSRTVEAGDELCICYSADESKLWFTPSGRASPAPSETSSQDEFPSLTSDDLFDADQMAERARRSAARAERKRQVALSDQAKARSTKRTALRDQVLQPIPTYPSAETNELELGTSLRADSASPAPSSTSSFPVYPTPAERPSSDLPLPLHSNGDAQEDPVDVCAALDWSEEAWAGLSQADVPDWGAAVRVKGTAELEEEAEDAALMEVWAVAVQAQRDTRLVLEFVRDQLPVEQATRHLKKVARRVDPDLHPNGSVEEAVTMVVLCSTTIMASQELCTALAAYHPSLAGLRPVRKIVPASPARTQEQLLIKSPMWPVTFAASLIRPGTSSDWTAARAAWVHAGILRSVAIALDAKKLGDLPVGVFCVSPPESLWPVIDGFIPPTADLRASGHDTRLTTGHPLKHASFNCIRNIANLRTQKPYSNMLPTRNGADYLLTSLSLFVTHEPCPMCCMALLHSRVREVFYVFPSKRGGGFESAFGVHGRKDLNHRFEVWRYEGKEVERWREELKVGDEYAL